MNIYYFPKYYLKSVVFLYIFSISISLVFSILIFSIFSSLTFAASYTWDGGGSTNNWSDCDNWSSNICPVAADTVTFNATSVKDSTVDASWTGTVTSLTISSGYSGTITMARSLTISTSYVQADGIFNASNQTLDINTTFTFSGGTFTASSGTTFIGSSLTVSGSSVFNHNNGTITFDAGVATLSCNNITFNLVSFTGQTGVKTVNSNCNLPLGNNPTAPRGITLNGTLTGTGTFTINNDSLILNAGASLSGFTGLNVAAASALNISGATADFSSYTTFIVGGTTTLNSGTLSLPNGADLNGALIINGGTFNAPSGTMTLAGNLTVSGSPTFNHNNGTITFDGGTGTLSCNNVVFNLVTIVSTSGTKTINTNCTLPLGNNPTIGAGGTISMSGTLSGTGTLTYGSAGTTFTLGATGVLSGFTGLVSNGSFFVSGSTLNLNSYTTVDFNAGLTLTAGILTAPPGVMTLATNLSINSGTFNHNNGTVTFDGATGTLSCGNVVFNLVVLSNTSTKTIQSNCSFPLGNNPVIGIGAGTAWILNGTLSGSGTLSYNPGTMTINAGGQLSGFNGFSGGALTVAGGTVDLSSYTTFVTPATLTLSSGSLALPSGADLNSALTISGGTFTAPSGTMTLAGALTISGAPTFNHNNGHIIFDGSSATLSCNNVTFNLVQIAHTSGTKTIQSSCNLPLGNNPTENYIGVITLNGGVLSGSGTLILGTSLGNGGIGLTSGSSPLSGFTGLVVTGSVTANGATTDLSSYSVFTAGGNVVVSSGSLSLPNGADLNGTNSTVALNISGGTFNAPSGSMNLAGGLSISGTPTFNHNNGTIVFDGTTGTLSCNNTTFNLVQFNHSDTKVVNSNCTLPLGNNPTLLGAGAISLSGTLTGTGLMTKSAGNLIINTTGQLSGFNALDLYILELSGANVDFSSYTGFITESSVVINSGHLVLPSGADIGGALSIITGIVDAPSGDLIVRGNWNFTGGTFNHNNGTVILIPRNDSRLLFGSATFNDLEIWATDWDGKYTIEAGTTQIIIGNLIIKGENGYAIILDSATPGSQWYIDPQGEADVSGADLKDSNNLGDVIALHGTSIDSGNNTNWNFYDPTLSNLTPSSLVSGDTTSDNTPTLSFDIFDSDTEVIDNVSYSIEIDNNSDFSSPIVSFTSGFFNQGNFSFTSPLSLPDGSYFVRFKLFDDRDGETVWFNVNSGDIAFIVNTYVPTVTPTYPTVNIYYSLPSTASSNDSDEELEDTDEVVVDDNDDIVSYPVDTNVIDDVESTKVDKKNSGGSDYLLFCCLAPFLCLFILLLILMFKKDRKEDKED